MSELSRVFASALSFVDYLATVPCHTTLWHTRLRGLTREEIHASVAATPFVPQSVSALVFAEPWCVDAVMNVPLLHRLSEVEPRLSMRIAPLSEHPLADLFPGRGGHPRVPTIVFFRVGSAEAEYWSERSRRTNAWFESFVRDHPMPPLRVVDNRPGTPELEAWMRLRFERESAAERGGLWRFAVAEWRDSIARLCQTGGARTPFALREAIRDDVTSLVALLADDEIGRTREAAVGDDVSRCFAAFDAIHSDPNNELLVAEDDKRVVGMLQITYAPGLSRRGAWRATIEGVRVRADRRGRGIGRMLMREAIARARTRRCNLIQLTTDHSRLDAHRFYETLGFRETQRSPSQPRQ